MTVVVPIDETGDCKEVNNTRTEVCVAEQQCPGENQKDIIHSYSLIPSFFNRQLCLGDLVQLPMVLWHRQD